MASTGVNDFVSFAAVMAILGLMGFGGYALWHGYVAKDWGPPPAPAKHIETVAEHACRGLKVQMNNGTVENEELARLIARSFCNDNPWIEAKP